MQRSIITIEELNACTVPLWRSMNLKSTISYKILCSVLIVSECGKFSYSATFVESS